MKKEIIHPLRWFLDRVGKVVLKSHPTTADTEVVIPTEEYAKMFHYQQSHEHTFTDLTPSADVQKRAKELYPYVGVENDGNSVKFLQREAYIRGASSGVQWVKASERLPNHHKEVCVKYHGRYYAGKRNHDSVHPAIYIEMPSGSVTTRDCEYLDESSPSSMQEELQQLRAWKESAMKVMNDIDLQECGKVIGVKLGHDVSPEILPALKRMREALSNIEKVCDNENPSHESIWRIAYEALNKQQ